MRERSRDFRRRRLSLAAALAAVLAMVLMTAGAGAAGGPTTARSTVAHPSSGASKVLSVAQVRALAAQDSSNDPDLPNWAIGPFTRYAAPGSVPNQGNPIMRPSGSGWECGSTYNPGVLFAKGQFQMLYRGQNCSTGQSQIGYAHSTDGHHFIADPDPVIPTTGDYEDPRLYQLNGRYYTFFTDDGPDGFSLAEATSTDLKHWNVLGDVEPNDKDASVVTNPDGTPVKIGGRYVMLYGQNGNGTFVAYSHDMIHWTSGTPVNLHLPASYNPVENCVAVTDYRTIAGAKPNTDIDLFISGTMMAQGRWYYAISEEELSRHNLTEATDQLTFPILQPEEPYEIVGLTPNTVFDNDIMFHDGKWWMYYGAADTDVALANAPLRSRASAKRFADFTGTSFEPGARQPDWPDQVDTTKAGGDVGVSNPVALVTYQQESHSGVAALNYSGDAASSDSTDRLFMKIFDFRAAPLAVHRNTTLSYWIFPENEAGTCVALDAVFASGKSLAGLPVQSSNGGALTPQGQCAHLSLFQWNKVTADIGAVTNGQRIVRMDLAYANKGDSGLFQGYVDDIKFGPQPVSLTTAASVTSGSSFIASGRLVNTTGRAISRIRATLSLPAGWTARRVAVPASSLKANRATVARWKVTLPAGAASAADPVTVSFSYKTAAGKKRSVSDQETVNVQNPTSPAYNNTGISDDSAPAGADFGGYASYSAEALAAAGVKPGTTFTAGGMSFTWPDVAAGTPDNYQAAGQTIPVTGTGDTLGILGSAFRGPLSEPISLNYTDGTSETVNLGLSDWTLGADSSSPSYGNQIAITTAYRNQTVGGPQSINTYVFVAELPLEAGKTLKSVTLPSGDYLDHTNHQQQSGSLNIFAMSVGSPSVAYNNTGITNDSDPNSGDFGGGATYSAQALAAAGVTPGSTVTAGGMSFTWPNVLPGTPDNYEADGQTVPVTGSGTTLGILGSSYYGPLSGTMTLNYTDGTSQTVQLGLSDWTLGGANGSPSYGNQIAITTTYRDTSGGESQGNAYVFATEIPLETGKTLRSVTLPAGGGYANSGAMHVFAMTVGTQTP